MGRLGWLLPMALAACVVVETAPGAPGKGPDVVPMPPEGRCGAPELQGLVGQPKTVLQTMRFAGPVRIIQPGMAVTMDYSPDRLNILIGGDGLIESVTCG